MCVCLYGMQLSWGHRRVLPELFPIFPKCTLNRPCVICRWFRHPSQLLKRKKRHIGGPYSVPSTASTTVIVSSKLAATTGHLWQTQTLDTKSDISSPGNVFLYGVGSRMFTQPSITGNTDHLRILIILIHASRIRSYLSPCSLSFVSNVWSNQAFCTVNSRR